MTIFVGSTNPVKTNAVIMAASEQWPEVVVVGLDVPTGVSEQPLSDAETQRGASNRARQALDEGLRLHPTTDTLVLGLGLEGGVTEYQDELWSTVWGCVVDNQDREFFANGARCKLPPVIADPIAAGKEMGPVVEKLSLDTDVRQKQGMIGVITKGFVDRTEEYAAVAKFALGLWYGRDWQNSLG